ncbi:hypothetical protein N7462_011605 [Penicillium macrosclerotiorum]|uniref:uncharacterized protein n=1 Tax=Penicillium macrosclerotiorum TaxID=303699 RepID=UPI0025490FAB|nr:uncharacterized protein N7462_011605 [Penicillium macrosclerotiorum]KAJ5662679.1 hypothetical protein N7462_011605 [Penicillium macrosclerotiorum]
MVHKALVLALGSLVLSVCTPGEEEEVAWGGKRPEWNIKIEGEREQDDEEFTYLQYTGYTPSTGRHWTLRGGTYKGLEAEGAVFTVITIPRDGMPGFEGFQIFQISPSSSLFEQAWTPEQLALRGSIEVSDVSDHRGVTGIRPGVNFECSVATTTHELSRLPGLATTWISEELRDEGTYRLQYPPGSGTELPVCRVRSFYARKARWNAEDQLSGSRFSHSLFSAAIYSWIKANTVASRVNLAHHQRAALGGARGQVVTIGAISGPSEALPSSQLSSSQALPEAPEGEELRVANSLAPRYARITTGDNGGGIRPRTVAFLVDRPEENLPIQKELSKRSATEHTKRIKSARRLSIPVGNGEEVPALSPRGGTVRRSQTEA